MTPNVPLILETIERTATSFTPLVETAGVGSFLVRMPSASLFEKAFLEQTI